MRISRTVLAARQDDDLMVNIGVVGLCEPAFRRQGTAEAVRIYLAG